MNYKPMYRFPLYVVTGALLFGCATRGSVKELSDKVSAIQAQIPPIQRSVGNLGQKVTVLEQNPYAERVVMIKQGQGLDELYGWVRGQILPQYKDPAARKEAEDKGNSVVLTPTGVKDRYYALVAKDDGDGLPSMGDNKFVDVVDGKQQKVQFVVEKKNLPELLRWQLINAVSAKPSTSHVAPK